MGTRGRFHVSEWSTRLSGGGEEGLPGGDEVAKGRSGQDDDGIVSIDGATFPLRSRNIAATRTLSHHHFMLPPLHTPSASGWAKPIVGSLE